MQQVCPQVLRYDANVDSKYRLQRKLQSEGKRKAAQAAQQQTLDNRYAPPPPALPAQCNRFSFFFFLFLRTPNVCPGLGYERLRGGRLP